MRWEHPGFLREKEGMKMRQSEEETSRDLAPGDSAAAGVVGEGRLRKDEYRIAP